MLGPQDAKENDVEDGSAVCNTGPLRRTRSYVAQCFEYKVN